MSVDMTREDFAPQLELFEAVLDDELLDEIDRIFGEAQLGQVYGALREIGCDERQSDYIASPVFLYGHERLLAGFVLGCMFGGVEL